MDLPGDRVHLALEEGVGVDANRGKGRFDLEAYESVKARPGDRAAVQDLGRKPVMVTGLGLLAIGLAWMGQAPADGKFLADQLGPFLPIAFAMGLAFVPMTIARTLRTGPARCRRDRRG